VSEPDSARGGVRVGDDAGTGMTGGVLLSAAGRGGGGEAGWRGLLGQLGLLGRRGWRAGVRGRRAGSADGLGLTAGSLLLLRLGWAKMRLRV
jgi:hypothetical protein